MILLNRSESDFHKSANVNTMLSMQTSAKASTELIGLGWRSSPKTQVAVLRMSSKRAVPLIHGGVACEVACGERDRQRAAAIALDSGRD